MQIILVKEAEEFANIKSAWEVLCDELSDNVTAYSSFEWYNAWWHHYSAGEPPLIITLWDAGKLVGIAPLMLRRATVHGLPVTAVCFMENNQSPHNDSIVMPAFRELFLREVMRVLSELTGKARWDVAFFNKLPITSANYEVLLKLLTDDGRKWRRQQVLDSRYLIPSGSWPEFLASRTSRTRKTLRNIQNSMQKAGVVSVRNIRTWEEFQQVREEVYSVAKQSWTEMHGDSIASRANEAFFDDLSLGVARKGWLSLWTLHLNGKMIAVEYHLRAYGKEHAMRGHYLPEFASLSPGTFLEMQILKNTFEEMDRVQKYDLGNFYDYKRKWTDHSEPHMAVSVFNNQLYSRFIALNETVTVPLLSRIIPQKFWGNILFKRCGINTNRLNIKQH